jgi:hypothetical protein
VGAVRAHRLRDRLMRTYLLSDLKWRADPDEHRVGEWAQMPGELHVVRLRCPNLRCRMYRVAIRRADENIDWKADRCPKCGRPPLVLQDFPARVELDGSHGVLRYRQTDDFGEPLGEKWTYLPFDAKALGKNTGQARPG